MSDVKALCRVCEKESSSSAFKLHHTYQQMVCPDCYSGRTKERQDKELQEKKATQKPPGWDSEDEYLDKMARMRQDDNQIQFTKVAGTNQVKCTCFSCKYEFKYDPFRKMPRTCPYCNVDIPKLRTFNLL